MLSKTFIKQLKPFLILLTLCSITACSYILVTAQNSPIDISGNTGFKEVRQAGYTFAPRPVIFQPDLTMELAFSIKRDDNTDFSLLKLQDIEAFQDDLKLPISALRNLTKTPVTAMILVDVSRSMRDQRFRKLDALKKALNGFIDRLEEDGERKEYIALAKFDLSPEPLADATSDKNALRAAVDSLDGKNRTWLYNAIKWSLDRAKGYGANSLIVLSDGVDSTKQRADAKTLQGEELALYKQELLDFEHLNEPEIISKAQDKDNPIRIYTIEMGNTDEKDEAIYVYRDSVGIISRSTGGEDYYIELRKLAEQNKSLRNALGEVLEEIRKLSKYDYSLSLPLEGRIQPDGRPHESVINFKLDGGILRAIVNYIWKPGERAPVEIETQFAFFESDYSHKSLSNITYIYLMMILALALMSGVPLAGQPLHEWRETRVLNRSIKRVKNGSPYIGQECPSEGSYRRFQEGDTILICPGPNCKQPHHLDCWQQAHGRCYIRNCSVSINPRPYPRR
jgi:hypothetical protein